MFYKDWSDEIHDALKNIKILLNDLQFVKNQRSKEKITNIVYSLFIDAYFERLILAIQKALKVQIDKKTA